MKKCSEILIEEYAREDNPGKSRRLQKFVEKLYDIDLGGGFIENLTEEEKDLDDHSNTRPGLYRIDYCLEEEGDQTNAAHI